MAHDKKKFSCEISKPCCESRIGNHYDHFSSFIKFCSSKRNTENTISDLYFNEESDYSEESTSSNEVFHSTILQKFYFEPEQKKTCDNESHDKETTEAVVRRYSSKQVFLNTSQISHENTCIGVSF